MKRARARPRSPRCRLSLAARGRPPIAVTRFPGSGHNLMRYRPDEVASAIRSLV